MPPGTSKLTRIHGAFVSARKSAGSSVFVKQQGKPAYDESIAEYEEESAVAERAAEGYDENTTRRWNSVTDLGQASISLVQRYMKIGYNRAARIIERMEAEGVVGPSDRREGAEGAGPKGSPLKSVTAYIESLGCPKNLVDAQRSCRQPPVDGLKITDQPRRGRHPHRPIPAPSSCPPRKNPSTRSCGWPALK